MLDNDQDQEDVAQEADDEAPPVAHPALQRRDHVAGTAPETQRRARARHDTSEESAGALDALDGYADPFEIKLAHGYVAFWVSERDAVRHQNRPWRMATWGDPCVVEYRGAVRGKPGTPITFNELTCYLMSVVDFVQLKQRDPAYRRQLALREQLRMRAVQSGETDIAGFSNPIPRRGRAHTVSRDYKF